MEVFCLCRCPKDSSASFLVRKLPAAEGKTICVQAPILGADSQAMEAWIQDFVILLESAAPVKGKGGGGFESAAPGEGKEGVELESVAPSKGKEGNGPLLEAAAPGEEKEGGECPLCLACCSFFAKTRLRGFRGIILH